jgi:hypothetical protein
MIVVADTSVFLNLCRVGHEELLRLLFRQVVAPTMVHQEFMRAVSAYPRFHGLVFPSWVQISVPAQPLATLVPAAVLDPGESDAISLAHEMNADAVLLDESSGRAVAKSLKLRTLGVLGILVMAKQASLIPLAVPVLDDLRSKAGFWVSKAAEQELRRACGE